MSSMSCNEFAWAVGDSRITSPPTIGDVWVSVGLHNFFLSEKALFPINTTWWSINMYEIVKGLYLREIKKHFSSCHEMRFLFFLFLISLGNCQKTPLKSFQCFTPRFIAIINVFGFKPVSATFLVMAFARSGRFIYYWVLERMMLLKKEKQSSVSKKYLKSKLNKLLS